MNVGKRLYIGNLPFSTNLESLKAAFAKYGDIEEATIVTNKFSGRSKGFGFVTFKNDADAEKARTEMNGKEFEGRQLQINEAVPFDPNKPREKKPFNKRGRFGGGRRFSRDDSDDDSSFDEEQ